MTGTVTRQAASRPIARRSDRFTTAKSFSACVNLWSAQRTKISPSTRTEYSETLGVDLARISSAASRSRFPSRFVAFAAIV
jgi:hypothetical protein